MMITVTRSAGTDGAILVFIDDVDRNDLRILVNDEEAFVGKPYAFDGNRPAKSVSLDVNLSDIDYEKED